jgi:hypothetical protein
MAILIFDSPVDGPSYGIEDNLENGDHRERQANKHPKRFRIPCGRELMSTPTMLAERHGAALSRYHENGPKRL